MHKKERKRRNREREGSGALKALHYTVLCSRGTGASRKSLKQVFINLVHWGWASILLIRKRHFLTKYVWNGYKWSWKQANLCSQNMPAVSGASRKSGTSTGLLCAGTTIHSFTTALRQASSPISDNLPMICPVNLWRHLSFSINS